MRFPALPAGAFIAGFLILIPGCWHWPSRSVPVLSLIAWLFITNIIYGENTLVWSDDVQDKAPVWCDISTKLNIGASMALPACNLCISRNLAVVGRGCGLDDRDRRRIALLEFGFYLGIPMIFMALHYIVQGHRYDIVQYLGCKPAVYVSIPGILIVWVPPLLLSVGSSVYAGIALHRFVQQRATFSTTLRASGSSMSTNRYKRLMAMSVTLMLWGTMLTSLMIWVNTLHGLEPWVSWENVHYNWNRADIYIWVLMSPQARQISLLAWWVLPVSTIISFTFSGFGEEAVGEYKRVGVAVVRMIPSRLLPKKIERISGGMEPPPLRPTSGSSFRGPSALLPTDAPATNQSFLEPPLTQPLRSLCSVVWPPRSKSQLQSPGKSSEWRWSARGEKSRPAPLQSDEAEGRLHDRAGMGLTRVTEPLGIFMRGSVQGVVEGRESRNQV